MGDITKFFTSRYNTSVHYLVEHPAVCLLAGTVIVLGAMWIINRTKKRKHAGDIDLNKYRPPFLGTQLEKMPYIIKWTVTRVLFLPTLLFNIFNYYTLPAGLYDWWNRIDKNLILGAMPFHVMVPTLYREGVRAVVNTCDEWEGPVSAYREHNIKHHWTPVIDYTSPTEDQIEKAVEFMRKTAERGDTVYLHCKAGKGRSVTIAICYLMITYQISAQNALKMIIQQRPQVSKYLWRRSAVIEFARRHNLYTEPLN